MSLAILSEIFIQIDHFMQENKSGFIF